LGHKLDYIGQRVSDALKKWFNTRRDLKHFFTSNWDDEFLHDDGDDSRSPGFPKTVHSLTTTTTRTTTTSPIRNMNNNKNDDDDDDDGDAVLKLLYEMKTESNAKLDEMQTELHKMRTESKQKFDEMQTELDELLKVKLERVDLDVGRALIQFDGILEYLRHMDSRGG
jgi:hypothetical protein